MAAFSAIPAYAQTSSAIVGRIEDDHTQPVLYAGVELLNPRDSSMVEGVLADENGFFRIRAVPGDYLLRVSSIGFVPFYTILHHTLSSTDQNLGNIKLLPDAVVLEGAVAVAKAPPVVVKEDTVLYNAAAYRVEDGANVDDLLKKIPGMQLDAAGNVTVQGKPVKQLFVNGKRFFGENVKSALKNLPADIVENVKTYERESDMARLSGVDDGEAEQVIDLTIKKHMMDSWRMNGRAGGGVSYDPAAKYNGRVNLSKIDKTTQISIIADARNVNGLSSFANTGNNVLGSGGAGMKHYRDAGVTFSKDTKKLQQSGNIHYDGNNADKRYVTESQYVYAKGGSWGVTNGMSLDRPDNITADYRLEWKPDKTTTFLLIPHFHYKLKDVFTSTAGTTRDKDPMLVPDSSAIVNSSNNSSHNKSAVLGVELAAQISHEFREAKRGRRLTFYTKYRYTNTLNNNFASTNTRYYKIKKNPDSLLTRNQYYKEDYDGHYAQGRLTYNEPIGKHLHLQFVLQGDYNFQAKTRDFYNFGDTNRGWQIPSDRDLSVLMASLPENYTSMYSKELSAEGNYHMLVSQAQLKLRLWYKKFNLTVGGTFSPTFSWLHYVQDNQWLTKTQNVFYAAPNLIFNYIQSKTAKFNLSYSSWSGAPGLYSILPVASGTNPLYIHYGNPDLKPSYTHRGMLTYNYSNPKNQNSFVASATFRLVQNAACLSNTYIAETGGRESTHKNIDGNWSLSGSAVYNESFRQSPFSLCTNLAWEYRNDVSLLYNNKLKEDEVNTVHRLMTKVAVDASYRNKWLEVVLDVAGEITSEHSLLRPEMDRMPYRITPGVAFIFDLPARVKLSTDFNVLFQRGYNFAELDRNFYVWNASISCPLMKKHLSLKLECRDILNQLPNTVCSFSSERRQSSIYQGSNGCYLISLIWNFKAKNQK